MRRSTVRRLTAALVSAALFGSLVAAAPGTATARESTIDETAPARAEPFRLVDGRPLDRRLPQPEDRYALASGCYMVELPGAGYLVRDADDLHLGPRETAVPLHFQATRLGEYLLATNDGPDTTIEAAWWDLRSFVAASGLRVLTGSQVGLADEPSPRAEWRVVASGEDPDASAPSGQDYHLILPATDQALGSDGGAPTLVEESEAAAVRFHRVRDDDPSDDDPNGTACADWPEIGTDTSGPPAPVEKGPADEVEGFFEAHVHGMAYEFLGGEMRCGQPWHPYGVEYALGNCFADEYKPLQPLLEVIVAGEDAPQEYDPQGWPTFDYWPQHDTLTHEQWYWRWVERSYHGGLRLLTNLLVENTALCQIYPDKENSCNEMDSVRLQAQRIFELQDYIDAQSGGPGEGWFRIVTSPAQARQVINAGRLAVVLGVEVSVVFDCGEVLDAPQCTEADLDQRVQEVFDMGVRQMEIINKFDNALSGVTGDAGATGLIVNAGNLLTTGHFWDMQTCDEAPEHDHHQHDRTQLNPFDDTPLGDVEEVDVLASAILELVGDVTGPVSLPVYPPGPHCNTRGLTDLGRHLIERLVEKNIIFDPDHMSAAAQREALDHIEQVVIPRERAAAAAEGRPPIQPAIMSSHSWGNDVIYRRILELDGVVAPRTNQAARFADYWAERRAWADEVAPEDYLFGMGFGADTNGLGSQPGPRPDPAVRLAYTEDGFPAPIGDVTIHQHTSGVRTYDINVDGVAHYGLFADWFREVALAADEHHPELGGGDAIIEDMLRGAETYLRLWERAVYGGNECVTDLSRFHVEDLHALLGLNFDEFLRAAGRPVDRDGAAYTYCAEGADGSVELVDVTFDGDGVAAEVDPSDAAGEPGAAGPAANVTAAAAPHAHVGAASTADQLPATGGGLVARALLLLGSAGVLAGVQRRHARGGAADAQPTVGHRRR